MGLEKFWMVLGSGTPTFRHPSRISAISEAERLAQSAPGQRFVVLEAKATVRSTYVTWEQNDMDNSNDPGDVPF